MIYIAIAIITFLVVTVSLAICLNNRKKKESENAQIPKQYDGNKEQNEDIFRPPARVKRGNSK